MKPFWVFLFIGSAIFPSLSVAGEPLSCTDEFEQRLPYRFDPHHRKVGDLDGQADPKTLLAEPMLFSAEWNFALQNGGVLTKAVLEKLSQQPEIKEVLEGRKPGFKIIIDSRVHVLGKSEFPAIPGWHTDFVPRPQKMNGQPDYTMVNKDIGMFLVNISNKKTGVSNTEFITESVGLNLRPQQTYMHVDRHLEAHPEISREKVKDGDVYFMDQDSLHRGTESHDRGIRFFLRAAVLDGSLAPKLLNEVRTQVQSYRVVKNEVENSNRRLLRKNKTSGRVVSRGGATPLTKFDDKPLLNDIKAEAILDSTSWSYAMEHAGPLTQKVLAAAASKPEIQEAIKKGTLRVNTRVHMLQSGQNADFPKWKNTDPFSGDLIEASGKTEGQIYFAQFSTKTDGLNETLVNQKDFEFSLRADRPAESISTQSVGPTQKLEQNILYQMPRGISTLSEPARQPGWQLSVWITTASTTAPRNKMIVQVPVFLEDPSLGW